MCSTQNIYDTRNKVAGVLGLAVEKVAIRYYEGAGTFGRSCYDDAAGARPPALLSRAAGQPVRLQFMRWDEHGWDNFGPAHLADVHAAIDETGKIVAYEYHGWQHMQNGVELRHRVGKPVGNRWAELGVYAMLDIYANPPSGPATGISAQKCSARPASCSAPTRPRPAAGAAVPRLGIGYRAAGALRAGASYSVRPFTVPARLSRLPVNPPCRVALTLLQRASR